MDRSIGLRPRLKIGIMLVVLRRTVSRPKAGNVHQRENFVGGSNFKYTVLSTRSYSAPGKAPSLSTASPELRYKLLASGWINLGPFSEDCQDLSLIVTRQRVMGTNHHVQS